MSWFDAFLQGFKRLGVAGADVAGPATPTGATRLNFTSGVSAAYNSATDSYDVTLSGAQAVIPSLVYRPGGTTSGNVYATEAELLAALPSAGVATVLLDGSANGGTVPIASTWPLDSRIRLVARKTTTVMLTGKLVDPCYLEQLYVSADPAGASAIEFADAAPIFELRDCTLSSASASKPVLLVEAGDTINLVASGRTSIARDAYEVFDKDAAGRLFVWLRDEASIGDDTIRGTTSGAKPTRILLDSAAASASTTQTNLTGAVVVALEEVAANVAFSVGEWTSTNVQAAIQEAVAKAEAYDDSLSPALGATTTQTAIDIVKADPLSRLQATTKKLLLLGDSMTQGFSSGTPVGGYRPALYTRLRQWRGDVDFIGHLHTYLDVDATNTKYTGAPGIFSLGRWLHSGMSGKKIEDLDAAYAGTIVATAGQPDLIVLMIGTNNVAAGDSLATMQTKFQSLIATIDATSPNAKVLISSIVPFVPGATTGANQATWEAAREAYNAWLASYVPTLGTRYTYIDAAANLGATDMIGDGVHCNVTGFALLADALAPVVDRLLGPRAGLTKPRPFRQQLALGSSSTKSVSLPALTDVVSIPASAAHSVASGDFAIQIDYYPTSIPGSGVAVIAQNGSPYTNGWLLAQNGAGLNFYLLSAGPAINTTAMSNAPPVLATGRWHRIVVVGNRARGLIGLYVNSEPIAVADSIAAWTSGTSNATYLGAIGGINAALGYYRNFRVYKGSGVPPIESKALMDALERNFYEQAPLCSGGTSYFQLNESSGTSVADQVYGASAGTLNGTATWASIAMPWDWQPAGAAQ